jgi:hypothetical protein
LTEGTGNPDDDKEKPYDPGFDTDANTDTTPEVDAWNGRMQSVELDRDGEVVSSTGNLSWGENLSEEEFRDYLHLINDQLNEDE